VFCDIVAATLLTVEIYVATGSASPPCSGAEAVPIPPSLGVRSVLTRKNLW